MIPTNKFTKAKQYIKAIARPLDIALFEFEFNDGSPHKVLKILKGYQNEDGGFGKALESDLRMKESSVLATTVALQYINKLNLSTPDKMVTRSASSLSVVKKHNAIQKGSR